MATVDFAARNAELFAVRDRVRDDLNDARAELDESEDAAARLQARRVRRLERQLDDVHTEIVNANFGLVRSYANRFRTKGRAADADEFESAGMVGLMSAISTYDPSKGPFAAWAYHPIQRAMTRSVRDVEYPNMNPGDFEKRPDILRARNLLCDGDPGVYVDDHDVADTAGVTVEQVRRVLHAPRLQSLAAPVAYDMDLTVGDTIVDQRDEAIDERVALDLSIDALERHGLTALSPRELYVIVRHYGLDGDAPAKLATIGTTLGLSREAARQIEGRARSKLNHPLLLRRLVRNGR
jgi:RNA polymerase sigma factor (sigma-70 family)